MAEVTDPPALTYYLSLAAQLLTAGKVGHAIEPLTQAARLQPGNAGIAHDLGLAYLECGQIGEAIAALRRAVALRPRFADAHLRLGIALEMADMFDDALAAYAHATRILSSLADAHYRAGALLESLGRHAPAAQAFRRAAAAAPKSALGRIAGARAKLSEHRDGDAEKILRRTLTLEPENAIALDLLGNVLAESGRFSQARETLLQAVARSPLLAGSYYEIARCRRIGPDDAPLVASMQAALAVPGLDAVQRSRVHLALGKAADDLGRYEVAMQHCDAAEALRNTLTPFDPGGLANRVDRLIACFTADLWERAPTAAPTGPSPILILGLPRSGTTLVEQIISSHPHVHAAGELPFWIERGTRWEAAIAGDAPVADIVAHTRAHAARGASDYLQRLRGLAPRAGWVTDKMPLNFQWAGLIHAALPHATLIHCRRVPIDTALSIHQTHFNPRMPFPTGGVGLVFYIRAYQRLCEHWRQVLPPKRFIEIDYEDLVGAPEIEIPRLISACGLTWHDACLRPEQNGRVVKTPSKWQARQPIHDTSRGRWRRYEPWLGALRALLDNVEPDERPV